MTTDRSAPRPALFERFPAVAARVPWLALGRFPTPVLPLPIDVGGSQAWIKRDDLSGVLYGGNKVRKLEFLLAEARRRGARRLITLGAAGSHHALATAIYGRELGFDVTLVLFPQPPTEHARRVLRTDRALGAEIRWAPHMSLLPAYLLAARLAHRGEPLYMVPGGGSNRIGTLGYVSGALELAAQVSAGEAPEPARIHVPGGTLGTAAGIALGLALAGSRARVVVTRVVSPVVTNEARVEHLLRGTAALLSEAGVACPSPEQVLARVEIDPAQLGAGYGHATATGDAAAERFAAAGIGLEPTYTAKAAASLLAMRDDGPVLFWNTFSSVEPLPPPEAGARLPGGAAAYLARG